MASTLSSVLSRLDRRSELPRWLPACSPALLAWLVASTLDYLKNRIPPARNYVSRLVFMYQYTLGWNNVGYSAACVHAANARLFAAFDFDLRSAQILTIRALK